MTLSSQRSLANVLASIRFADPVKAEILEPDFRTVGLYALAADNTPAKEAADRLRRAAFDLPVIQARVLEQALTDLGY